jgi:hypothetical protein
MIIHCRRDYDIQKGLCGEFYNTVEVFGHFFAYPDFFYEIVSGADVVPGNNTLCEVCTGHEDYLLVLLAEA